MNKMKLTKDSVLTTITDEAERNRMSDVDLAKDNVNFKLRQAAEDRVMDQKVYINRLKEVIQANSSEIGVSESRKLLAGLECLEYEIFAEFKIVGYTFEAGRNMRLDSKGTLSKYEKNKLKTYTKMINDCIKIANNNKKKLGKRREDGKKLGKNINDYAKKAENMVYDMSVGISAEQALVNETGIEISKTRGF